MDELLLNLKNQHPSLLVQAFADDLIIAQMGKSADVICARVREGLNTTSRWCLESGLELNPSKTEVIPFSRKRGFTLSNLRFRGRELQISDKVRYLGVVIDKRLTWMDHVTLKSSKATSQFAVCRRVVGRKWGMSPHVMKWLYTAVIRPSLEYGAVVWAHKADLPTYARRLERMQRCACLAITGAMSTTATEAMESILGLTPLDIHVQGRALATWHRLERDQKTPWDMLQTGPKSHIQWCIAHSLSIPILSVHRTLIDHNVSTLRYRNFSIEILPRSDWSTDISLPVEGLVCFTDGSRVGDMTGSGVLILGRKSIETVDLYESSVPLGSMPTVFQTELHAIAHAASWFLDNDVRGENINIYSDSRSALEALRNPISKSKLVSQTFASVQAVCANNGVTLHWIPGHSNLQGNERADGLARTASESLPVGPEPFLPVTTSYLRGAIKDWRKARHCRKWRDSTKCRSTKIWVPTPWYGGGSPMIHTADRDLWRLVMGLITGHCQLNQHRHRIGLSNSPQCNNCVGEIETPYHFLAECPQFLQQRLLYFGEANPQVDTIREIPNSVLVAYINATRRFEDSQ